MANVNKVILVGRLTGDPELKYIASGAAVCSFSVAVDRKTKEKQTDFIRVQAWDRLGEICNEFLHKGKEVYIEGSLQVRKYEDKDGNKREATEVRAFVMEMCGSKSDGAKGGNGGGGQRSAPRESSAGYGDGGGSSFDNPLGIDDIPFAACKV